MDREEQLVGLSNNDATNIIAKGKRTKRLRLLSAGGATVMTSSCSSSANSGDGDCGSFSSATTTYESTEEEEDMANCLILLAQGGGGDSHDHHQGENQDDGNNKGSSCRKFAEVATATNTVTSTKVGFFIYECKTCNRTFPSFQALGGHRASHKKPKLMMAQEKITNYDQFYHHFEEAAAQSRLQLGSQGHKANKAKVHECSICGSEFTSGQALGGHMRRHRASASASASTQAHTSCDNNTEPTQPRNILELDLNLPAPEEESKFQFTATTQNSMVLSAAPALVDCHY